MRPSSLDHPVENDADLRGPRGSGVSLAAMKISYTPAEDLLMEYRNISYPSPQTKVKKRAT